MRKSYFFCLAFALVLLACNDSDYKKDAQKTVQAYSEENPRLRTLYGHYEPTDPRFEAVCFLLAGLPNK